MDIRRYETWKEEEEAYLEVNYRLTMHLDEVRCDDDNSEYTAA